MKNVAAVILAAGKGTRMKSALPKVLHEVCGLPLIRHVIAQTKKTGIKKIIVVVGYRKDLVKECLQGERVEIVEQIPQLGTGHALLVSEKKLKTFQGQILVLDGDVYFDNTTILKDFYSFHIKNMCDMSILTTTLGNPFGYGRIIRNEQEDVVAIREELNASQSERALQEINTGIYLFKGRDVFPSLRKVKKDSKKKEYYLTSVVDIYRSHGKKIGGFTIKAHDVILGVNDREQLADIQGILQRKIVRKHQHNGVTITAPENTYIETNVTIGNDTIIYPFTYIEKDVRIGTKCTIGPFCKIRMGSSVKRSSHIGSFVEIVRSHVGNKTNIKHLSYIGDTTVGNNVNIGAGTITANFDGKKKNKTYIKDGAFIGSNTVLVAPLTVGERAKTGAGTVVPKRKNIPKGKTAVGIPARVISSTKKSKIRSKR